MMNESIAKVINLTGLDHKLQLDIFEMTRHNMVMESMEVCGPSSWDGSGEVNKFVFVSRRDKTKRAFLVMDNFENISCGDHCNPDYWGLNDEPIFSLSPELRTPKGYE